MSNLVPTPTQMAYGLLWRRIDDDVGINEVRRILRDALSEPERKEAIEWAVKEKGPPAITAETLRNRIDAIPGVKDAVRTKPWWS